MDSEEGMGLSCMAGLYTKQFGSKTKTIDGIILSRIFKPHNELGKQTINKSIFVTTVIT